MVGFGLLVTIKVLVLVSSLQHFDSYDLNDQDINCSMSWINYVDHHNGLNVIGDFVPACIYRELSQFNIRLTVWNNLTRILTPAAREQSKQIKCKSFLLMDDQLDELKVLFNGGKQYFYTFTKIFIIRLGHEINEIFNENELEYISNNALNVYIIENNRDNLDTIEFSEIRNVLTDLVLDFSNATDQDLYEFYGTDLSHPFLDVKNENKEFTVSAFNCSPFVIYNGNHGTNLTFDGIDYRIFYEVAKYWIIKWNMIKPTSDGADPYRLMVDDLTAGVSDIALCRLWMTLRHHTLTDLGVTDDHQYVKFLAPLPTLVDDAAAIYSSLSLGLWITYGVCLTFIGILLTFLTKIDARTGKSNKNLLAHNYLYLISIATNHGIRNLPKRLHIRYILLSWMLVSLAVGTGYSTAYISILTSPKFSTPVDTVEQFLEKGYRFGEMYNHTNFIIYLRASNDSNFLELTERQFIFRNYSDMREKLASGQYGVFTKITNPDFLYDCEWAVEFASSLRIVKQSVLSVYAAYGFQKGSPYRKLFDYYKSRLIETGIIAHWISEFGDTYKTNQYKLFQHPDRLVHNRQQLSLKNLSGAFYVLIIGYTISFSYFLLELFVWKIKVSRNKNTFSVRSF